MNFFLSKNSKQPIIQDFKRFKECGQSPKRILLLPMKNYFTLFFGMLRYFANLTKSLNSKFRPSVFPNSFVDSELVPNCYVFCQALFFITNIGYNIQKSTYKTSDSNNQKNIFRIFVIKFSSEIPNIMSTVHKISRRFLSLYHVM